MKAARDAFWSVSKKTARDLLFSAVLLGGLLLGRASFADHYRVPTGSMLPTIELDDHVLLSKCAYGLRLPLTERYLVHWGEPARGDVVVLQNPSGDSTPLLKRVVAVPGDHVEVQGGRLLLGGVPVPIDGGREAIGRLHVVRLDDGGGPPFGPTVVPPGRFLVMGDNRGNSHDGRSFGLVERDALLGHVLAVVYRGGPAWEPL